MSSLAQIEIVLFLREVELLRFCSAEEILRIASIASERRFEKGACIFEFNDPPDVLYFVVSGRVRLEGSEGDSMSIEPRSSFGVRGILSGRLRASRATAEEETLVVALDADDFFDLLSNNIEIVKALFRQLTSGSVSLENSALI